MADQPTLRLLCGWIASGKSTLATELGHGPRTVVVREDDWLQALYGAEFVNRQAILTPYRHPKMTPIGALGSWPDAV